jgi:hypothetical protein
MLNILQNISRGYAALLPMVEVVEAALAGWPILCLELWGAAPFTAFVKGAGF